MRGAGAACRGKKKVRKRERFSLSPRASRTSVFLSSRLFTEEDSRDGRIYAIVLFVAVIVGNVDGTAQRNVARGELAARPVSLTRDGLRQPSPFRCSSLSFSFFVFHPFDKSRFPPFFFRESARFRFLSPNCRDSRIDAESRSLGRAEISFSLPSLSISFSVSLSLARSLRSAPLSVSQRVSSSPLGIPKPV